MDPSKIAEMMDQERWLLNSGLVSESTKNQLFFCGSIVHKDVKAVECSISVETKTVSYQIFVPSSLLKKVQKYEKLAKSDKLFDLLRVRHILKKEGDLNFKGILSKFIKDYCGGKWSTTVEILDFDKYFDGDDSGKQGGDWSFNQLPNEQRRS